MFPLEQYHSSWLLSAKVTQVLIERKDFSRDSQHAKVHKCKVQVNWQKKHTTKNSQNICSTKDSLIVGLATKVH